ELTPSLGVDYSYLGLGEEFKLQNRNVVGQLRAELRYKPTPAFELVPGVDFIGGTWWFDFKSAVRFSDVDDPLAEREGVGFDGVGTLWTPDLYLKANLRPLKGTDRLLITPGVRASIYTLTQGGEVSGTEA